MIVSPNQITGLILTGGRGSRVGEQDKGLLIFQEAPLIERQLNWFSTQVSQIIISANRNLDKYRSYNFPVYSDLSEISEKIAYSGPLTGVITCLKQTTTKWLFVQPVDMPLMPDNLIEKLCLSITENADVYYLASSQRSHYLSMLISINALPELEDFLQQGDKKVKKFLDSVGAVEINLGIEEKNFTNLNELADYK